MKKDRQRKRRRSKRGMMPLWMRQVIDAVAASEKKHGKLAKAKQQKDQAQMDAIKDKTQKLAALLQEKGKELAPRGEWRKYFSGLLSEYLDSYSPSQSAIYAFTAGYTWQKYRKTWVSRDKDHRQDNNDPAIRLASDLHLKIEYHRYCYHVKKKPEIADHDYDNLLQQLTTLENEHPGLKRQPTKACQLKKWIYEVEKLLEADISAKGDLPQCQIVKARGGKLDQALIDKFYNAIPDIPADIVPDMDWRAALYVFFTEQFQDHTILPACQVAFACGAAWHKYRNVLDQ